MRALIFFIAIVLLLSLIGWISFSKGSGRSSINVETDQIHTDTDRVIQSGAELLHKAGDNLEKNSPRQTEKAPSL